MISHREALSTGSSSEPNRSSSGRMGAMRIEGTHGFETEDIEENSDGAGLDGRCDPDGKDTDGGCPELGGETQNEEDPKMEATKGRAKK